MNMEQRDILFNMVILIIRELDSSSSSESYDEELEILSTKKRRKIPRVQNYVEQIIPTLTDGEFKAHFRICTETFNYILSLIEPRLKRQKCGTPTILPRKQFLLALWRLATPDSYRSICERFGVARSSALLVTRRVVNALVKLAPIVIKWPTGEKVNRIWFGFNLTSGFPKVIGAIDGTHINIPAPTNSPEAYVNRKGHHSIQLQAICDQNCQFIHCYTGHVGSVHDQRVFRLSEVESYLGDASKFPEDCYIVGDSAYKLHENLMIPYRDNGHLTERQRNYNFCHASARIAIERAFGLLKVRFRSLLTTLAMERVDLIPKFILACCVLHNICIMRGDELQLEINEHFDDTNEIIYENDPMHDFVNAGTANQKRDEICETLPMRNV